VFLTEPPPTGADLNFSIFGYRVRISVWFWLVAFLLGARLLDGPYPRLIFAWVVVMFVSILIHELGHCLAFTKFGIRSHVVLYQFGGLAIPESARLGYGGRLKPWQQIAISAAGPAIQLFLAAILIVSVRVAGYQAPFYLGDLDLSWLTGTGKSLAGDNVVMANVVFFLLQVNIFWALLNLLPIYPLDGGQIARELFLLYSRREPIERSLILSIATAVGVAIWAFVGRETLIGIMFAVLAWQGYMTLQAYTGRGGYGGGNPW